MPEYLLQRQMQDNMEGIWADMLLKLNQIVATLRRDQSQIPPIASRLADFTVFCKRIEKSGIVDGPVLIHGLRSLVDRQKTALLEASPFIVVLEEWLGSQDPEITKSHTVQELFSILEPLARSRKLPWRWSSAAALSRHIMAMLDPLEKLYRATMTIAHDNAARRDVSKIKFET
jgi:hypothetical protein